MSESHLKSLPEWNQAAVSAGRMALPKNHLKHLIRQAHRMEDFSLHGGGLFYDFSRQRLDAESLRTLINLARVRKIKQQFNQMISGEQVNTTEKRSALHTATRSFSDDPIMSNGRYTLNG